MDLRELSEILNSFCATKSSSIPSLVTVTKANSENSDSKKENSEETETSEDSPAQTESKQTVSMFLF